MIHFLQKLPTWLSSALIGLAFTLTISNLPLVKYMGWFLSALFHELGHTLYSLYVGCPAFPAISLAGHAVTQHSQQRLVITWLVLICLITLVVKSWQTNIRYFALAILMTYPILAYVEPIKELGHLLSGHLGEMAFAAIFLWRGLTGIDTGGSADRLTYCLCSWYIIFQNIYLCFGIAFIPSSLHRYRENGSFGLVNDYLRINDGSALPVIMIALILLYSAIAAGAIFFARNEG